jgi:hypothetical protein
MNDDVRDIDRSKLTRWRSPGPDANSGHVPCSILRRLLFQDPRMCDMRL